MRLIASRALALTGLTYVLKYIDLSIAYAIWSGAGTALIALIGATATVKSHFKAGEQGSVFVAGEWWNAQLVDADEADSNTQVTVVARDGYTLRVTPAAPQDNK